MIYYYAEMRHYSAQLRILRVERSEPNPHEVRGDGGAFSHHTYV